MEELKKKEKVTNNNILEKEFKKYISKYIDKINYYD